VEVLPQLFNLSSVIARVGVKNWRGRNVSVMLQLQKLLRGLAITKPLHLVVAQINSILRSNLMIHSIQLLSHIDSIITAALRIYAMGSEIFSIATILVALNFLATMIQRTYQVGYAVGTFYWMYLHKPLRWLLIHLVTLVIMLSQLTWEGAVYVYQHRQEIISWCTVQYQLVKQSFATVYQQQLQALLVLSTDIKLLLSNSNSFNMATMKDFDMFMRNLRQEDAEILADIAYQKEQAMREEWEQEREDEEEAAKDLLAEALNDPDAVGHTLALMQRYIDVDINTPSASDELDRWR
tara:strand:+ start:100 stop:984 length:885 start_codon:yes stop_codon:yes gene_type:complete